MATDEDAGYQLAAIDGIDREQIDKMDVDRTDGPQVGEYKLTATVDYRARESFDGPEVVVTKVLSLTVSS